MPAAASTSTTLRSTSRRVAMSCARSVSATCEPIFDTGLRFDIGSCGTRPIDPPRILRSSDSFAPTSSRPSKRMLLPSPSDAVDGSRPMIAIALVDLPEPDSPTIATVSPWAMSRSKPVTAST
jgi:hypothetical protein